MRESKLHTYLAVLVVSLGYFVDILDLTLFAMLRVPSLTDLGVVGDAQVSAGILLLNSQMAGMLLGGFLWGILGDKKGRIQMLFASILTYSVANLLNAAVHDIPTYALLRFISGIGLAGELGVGISLIAELLPAHSRGVGTTLVTTLGVLVAVVGGFIVELFSWRTCYIIGGSSGLLLLLLRLSLKEASIFSRLREQKNVQWGKLSIIFGRLKSFKKFSLSVLIGIPIWYVAGILMAFSPEIAKSLGVMGEIKASRTIAIGYLGLALGDLLCGMLSQLLKKRILAVQIFLGLTGLLIIGQLTGSVGGTAEVYYLWSFFIGIGAGYWAVFVTIGAEQFGTNVRATVATTIPNLVRGSVIPVTTAFQLMQTRIGILPAAAIVGSVVFLIAAISSYLLPETFGKNLDYIEGVEL